MEVISKSEPISTDFDRGLALKMGYKITVLPNFRHFEVFGHIFYQVRSNFIFESLSG